MTIREVPANDVPLAVAVEGADANAAPADAAADTAATDGVAPAAADGADPAAAGGDDASETLEAPAVGFSVEEDDDATAEPTETLRSPTPEPTGEIEPVRYVDL